MARPAASGRLRRLGVLASSVIATGLLLTGAAPEASAPAGAQTTPVTFSVANATGNAAGDRVQGGSNAFPNFSSGAFDNFYPLAHVHLDGSPASEAAATPADTGPVGEFAASQGNIVQPQYATAHYPPGTTKPNVIGSPGGPYGQASATKTEASAYGEYAATTPVPSGTASSTRMTPVQRASSARAAPRAAPLAAPLAAALRAWRQAWLTAADAAAHPMPTLAAAPPDGVQNATSMAMTSIDPTTGALVITSTAHVQSASFGGGQLQLGDIDVSVSITNGGTPQPQISIAVGSASVAGVPVSIGKDGVNVLGTTVPGLSQNVQQASAALNQALTSSGYSVYTVQPAITTSTNHEIIEAAGLVVAYNQPATVPGVPQQEVIHDLGYAFADDLAVPATPTPPTTLLPTTLGSSGPASPPASSVFVPGTPGTPGTPATAGTSSYPSGGGVAPTTPLQRATATAFRRTRPLSLVLLYFLWEALVIGTVAALWWRRQEVTT